MTNTIAKPPTGPTRPLTPRQPLPLMTWLHLVPVARQLKTVREKPNLVRARVSRVSPSLRTAFVFVWQWALETSQVPWVRVIASLRVHTALCVASRLPRVVWILMLTRRWVQLCRRLTRETRPPTLCDSPTPARFEKTGTEIRRLVDTGRRY